VEGKPALEEEKGKKKEKGGAGAGGGGKKGNKPPPPPPSNHNDETSIQSMDESISEVMPFNNSEAIFVLQWLNTNVCRKPFEVRDFPQCILETAGDIVIDCIEQMCGKKVPLGNFDQLNGYRVPGTASKERLSEKEKDTQAANRLVYKHQQILNFMVNNGALLSHVSPVSLVPLSEHLIAQGQCVSPSSQHQGVETSCLAHSAEQAHSCLVVCTYII
jgi:hypothetical protein